MNFFGTPEFLGDFFCKTCEAKTFRNVQKRSSEWICCRNNFYQKCTNHENEILKAVYPKWEGLLGLSSWEFWEQQLGLN